jgi:hypothetical protein
MIQQYLSVQEALIFANHFSRIGKTEPYKPNRPRLVTGWAFFSGHD